MKKNYRKRFRAVVALQVLLLLGTVTLFAWAALRAGFVAVPIVVLVVIALQVGVLLHTVAAHVDALEEFFAAVNYEDFTRRFVEGDVDSELRTAFNRIIERFQDARAARDLQANYLETVVRHLPIAFMAARADGSLRLVNNPARRLTGLPALAHLDDLAALDASLPVRMRGIEAGGQKLLQTRLRGVPAELRVSVAAIRTGGGEERLYSLENLSGELTAREASAWRNLIRVLTHEIMNTLTPVTSLAESCTSMVADRDAEADLRDAVETIARRSAGLTEFVSSYRELLKVPAPQPVALQARAVLDGVLRLMAGELADIAVQVDVRPESLAVHADPGLLDQVLLNLLRNAIDAVAGRPQAAIRLAASLDYGAVAIRVTDNGSGIPQDLHDQVFVPFFTTKRDGNGIGLSLCRQIMSAHGGEISLSSAAGETEFVLRF